MAKELRTERSDDLFKEYVIARIEKHGERFEVLVKPDAIQAIQDGKPVSLEVLAIDTVFRDARKGTHAPVEKMKEIFETEDPIKVAEVLIRKGEIQLTTEQRREMLEQKRRAIVTHIATHAINPQTGTPHPPQRIEIAMEEARVRVDERKGVEEQVKTVLDAIRPLIPIRFEKARIAVKLNAEDAAKCYGDLKAFGAIVQEEWQKDGSWIGVVEMPAGMQTEFLEKLNARTRGNVETRLLKRGGAADKG